MKTSTRSLSAVAIVAVALFVLQVAPPARLAAFNKTWVGVCADGGLWDDAPGAGKDNESGFFWFLTNSAGNEFCTYHSDTPSLDTVTYTKLSVRAAVNDGAVLSVQLRTAPGFSGEFPNPECSGDLLGTVTISGNATPGTPSRSEFVTGWVDLAPGFGGQVCMTLNDAPNNVASERASALVDYIKIAKNINPPCPAGQICVDTYPPSTAWLENFTRAQ